jgi:hypothetical protein
MNLSYDPIVGAIITTGFVRLPTKSKISLSQKNDKIEERPKKSQFKPKKLFPQKIV